MLPPRGLSPQQVRVVEPDSRVRTDPRLAEVSPSSVGLDEPVSVPQKVTITTSQDSDFPKSERGDLRSCRPWLRLLCCCDSCSKPTAPRSTCGLIAKPYHFRLSRTFGAGRNSRTPRGEGRKRVHEQGLLGRRQIACLPSKRDAARE